MPISSRTTQAAPIARSRDGRAPEAADGRAASGSGVAAVLMGDLYRNAARQERIVSEHAASKRGHGHGGAEPWRSMTGPAGAGARPSSPGPTASTRPAWTRA